MGTGDTRVIENWKEIKDWQIWSAGRKYMQDRKQEKRFDEKSTVLRNIEWIGHKTKGKAETQRIGTTGTEKTLQDGGGGHGDGETKRRGSI